MTLHQLDTPIKHQPRHYIVFGRILTRTEVLILSRELHRRGDYDAGLRALHEAGLTPHDLIEASDAS